MVNHIAHGRVLLLRLPIRRTVTTGHLRKLFWCAGEPDDGGMEIGCIFLESLWGIPFRIHADEDRLHARQLIRRQLLQRSAQISKTGRTNIRAPGVTEVQHHHLAPQVPERHWTIGGAKHEVTSCGRLRDIQCVPTALSVRRRVPEQQAEENDRQDKDDDPLNPGPHISPPLYGDSPMARPGRLSPGRSAPLRVACVRPAHWSRKPPITYPYSVSLRTIVRHSD